MKLLNYVSPRAAIFTITTQQFSVVGDNGDIRFGASIRKCRPVFFSSLNVQNSPYIRFVGTHSQMETTTDILPTAVPQIPEHSPIGRWGPWTTLLWGAGCGGVLFVSELLGIVVFMMWWRIAYPGQPLRMDEIGMNAPALAFAFIVSTPFILGFVAFTIRLTRVPIREYLALRWPTLRDIGIGVAALLATFGLFAVLEYFANQETPAFLSDIFESASMSGMLPLVVIAFVLIAPLQEEVLFRGFLYRGLAQGWGPVPAVVLTSAAWSVLHVQYNWFFVGEVFLLGLILGGLRWRSGSLLLTLLIHALNNGLAMLATAFSCS